MNEPPVFLAAEEEEEGLRKAVFRRDLTLVDTRSCETLRGELSLGSELWEPDSGDEKPEGLKLKPEGGAARGLFCSSRPCSVSEVGVTWPERGVELCESGPEAEEGGREWPGEQTREEEDVEGEGDGEEEEEEEDAEEEEEGEDVGTAAAEAEGSVGAAAAAAAAGIAAG